MTRFLYLKGIIYSGFIISTTLQVLTQKPLTPCSRKKGTVGRNERHCDWRLIELMNICTLYTDKKVPYYKRERDREGRASKESSLRSKRWRLDQRFGDYSMENRSTGPRWVNKRWSSGRPGPFWRAQRPTANNEPLMACSLPSKAKEKGRPKGPGVREEGHFRNFSFLRIWPPARGFALLTWGICQG